MCQTSSSNVSASCTLTSHTHKSSVDNTISCSILKIKRKLNDYVNTDIPKCKITYVVEHILQKAKAEVAQGYLYREAKDRK